MQIVYYKTGIAIFFSIVVVLVLYKSIFFDKLENKFPKLFFGLAFFFCRLLPFGLIYLVAKFEAHSDVPMFYFAAKDALALKFVYKDFQTAYQPLFPYITALPLLFWNKAEAIILEMIVIEGVIVHFSKILLHQTAKGSITLTYFLLPAPFVLSVLGGQEDIWMWGFVVAMLWLNKFQKSEFWIGIIAGLGLITSKVVLILIIIPLFFYSNNKKKYILGLISIGIPTLLILITFSGFGFLEIINQANDPRTPNLWSILNPFFDVYSNIGIKTLNNIGLLSCLMLGIGLVTLNRENQNFKSLITKLWICVFLWFMIIQQSSLANYVYIFILPLWYVYNQQKNSFILVVILLLNILVVVQPAIWWHLNMPIITQSDLSNSFQHLIEYLLEIVIVSLLGIILLNQLKIKNKEPKIC